MLGPDMIREEMEKVEMVRRRMKEAQDRQKSYADKRRKDLEFEVGDVVYVKITPIKGVIRFGKAGKLAPRYIGPFKIIERIGSLAYRVELPERLSGVHNVFHVSHLRKSMPDPSSVVEKSVQDDLEIELNLTVVRNSVSIVD